MEQEPKKYARKCSHCGCGMMEGYVINAGMYYFCDDPCLDEAGFREYYDSQMPDEDDDFQEQADKADTYWTDWYDILDDEDDDDWRYIEINGVLTEIEPK